MSHDDSEVARLVARLRHQLEIQRANNEQRNRQLDALGIVWCDGGCEGGMLRFHPDREITAQMVADLITNARRAASWYIARAGKVAPRGEHETAWKAAREEIRALLPRRGASCTPAGGWDDMTDQKPRETVDTIAATLRVMDKSDHGAWRIWKIRGERIFDTWVVQGPQSIVVTGDGASAVFERPGGLGIGFAAGGLDYAAQKCRAGQVYGYNGDKARSQLEADLDEQIKDADVDGEAARLLQFKQQLDDLDFNDENGVNAWYYDGPGQGGDYPHFGRVFDDDFLRAVACVLAVYRFEERMDAEETSR